MQAHVHALNTFFFFLQTGWSMSTWTSGASAPKIWTVRWVCDLILIGFACAMKMISDSATVVV
jgi:hypothetical protein